MSNNRYGIEIKETVFVNRETTKLLYVSSAKYGGDWNSTMHTHAYTEIFYVIGGVGQFKIEELTYSVVKDDMVVVNSNIAHTEVSVNASPLEYIVLGIEGLEFTTGDEDGNRFCVVNFKSEREDILHYLYSMLREIENKADRYVSVCQDLLEILLVLLTRRTNFALAPTHPGVKSIKNCATVRRYIDTHFKENITLDQLAKLAHFNKYYMAHSFSQQYGISPINYLIARRVEESKYLLNDTNLSLSVISHLLGFSSQSYFSQAFRRQEGLSPIEYRKQHHNT